MMQRFRYFRDPLFLLGCTAYVCNRWFVKPLVPAGVIHSQFNDVWLIPCALPVILWLHRQLRLRTHDNMPQGSEIVFHLLFWSILFEWIGPKFVPRATGDPLDVIAYSVGALAAGIWWHRKRWALVKVKP